MPAADPADEAAEALMALGYKPPEAVRMVRTVAVEGMASEEIIRAALRGAVK
jgi:holliday junction DNA helicase RuvA